MKSFLMYCLAALLGAVIYGELSKSHPCESDWEPSCKYVQVINPITGKVEQQYVCD